MDKKKLLRISEIADKVGVLPSTIRYYTDLGLISPSSTTEGGHRLYSEEEVVPIIRQIQFLVRKGYTIEQIKKEIENIKNKKKILVIDDEIEICELITDLLKDKFPCEIKVARDGFTAGRLMNDFLPDLIILDLLLPGINGFEICRNIRQDEYLKHTKILAITGYDTPEHKKEIFTAGTDDYLSKPMDLSVLYTKICQLLNIELKTNKK